MSKGRIAGYGGRMGLGEGWKYGGQLHPTWLAWWFRVCRRFTPRRSTMLTFTAGVGRHPGIEPEGRRNKCGDSIPQAKN